MALLAETLVEEWLNRAGFFTVRGIRAGVDELDLLAVRPGPEELEARHVEVQVSINPVAYITPLTKEDSEKHGKGKTSAWARPKTVLENSVASWVEKKFSSKAKSNTRNKAWPNLSWSFYFVHGKVKHPDELALIGSHGIETIRFIDVLQSLCRDSTIIPKGGAGSDIADMIAYYESFRGDLI